MIPAGSRKDFLAIPTAADRRADRNAGAVKEAEAITRTVSKRTGRENRAAIPAETTVKESRAGSIHAEA